MASLFGSKGSYTYDPYGAWNPEQKSLGQMLGPYIQGQIGNAPTYTGNYTSPLTPSEQEVLDNQSRLANMVSGWSNKFQPGEINPEINANELRNLNQQFYGNGTDPGAKALAEEQYAGSGGYWGTPRANAVMSAYQNNVTTPYQNWRSTALQNSYNNALSYASGASSLNQATEQLQQIPRLISQYGLDQQYKEWTRGQEANQQYINDALNFLNISSGTTTYKPGEKGMIGDIGALVGAGIGTIVAPGVGTSVGAQLGGGLGGMFDQSGTETGNATSSLSNTGMQIALLNALNKQPTTTGGMNYTVPTYTPMSNLTTAYNQSSLNALGGMGNYKYLGSYQESE